MRRCWSVLLVVIAACGTSPAVPTTGTTGGVTTTATTIVVPATSPPATLPRPEPWAVVVVGDFGTDSVAELAVAGAMSTWVSAHPETRALVTTGDNFYTSDVVAAWEVPYGWVATARLPVWAVPGNHDLQTAGQWQASVTAFGSFPRWRTQEVAGVTFVLLDSNQAASEEQRSWLEQTARALTGRPWIAVFHHPLNNCGHHGTTPAVVEHWAPLLESARLILNGHDHNYQRFATESGWSVVTGGGGRSLHDLAPCPAGTAAPVAAEVSWHFVAIVGLGDLAVVTAYDVYGGVIDSFDLDLAIRP